MLIIIMIKVGQMERALSLILSYHALGAPTPYSYTALEYRTFLHFCVFTSLHFTLLHFYILLLSYHALGAPTPYSYTALIQLFWTWLYCTIAKFHFFTFSFFARLHFCTISHCMTTYVYSPPLSTDSDNNTFRYCVILWQCTVRHGNALYYNVQKIWNSQS